MNPERAGGSAVIGAAAATEIDDADQAERPECCVVETSAAIDVAYAE